MKQPDSVDNLHGVFEGPDALELWAWENREKIAGQFSFIAHIEGWYVLGEWNGNPETTPQAIARHTRGFWEYKGVPTYEGMHLPGKSKA